jgi:dihydropyrimidine dehydrogenase (NADP+)
VIDFSLVIAHTGVLICPRASLPYFTTHTDLVQRQKEAIKQRKAIRMGLQSDKDWTGDGFVKETESMVSN